MNEIPSKQALPESLYCEPGQLPDPGAVTRRIIRRDGIRVWLLGYFCLVAWLVVSIGGWFISMEALGWNSDLVNLLVMLHNRDEPLATPQINPAQPSPQEEGKRPLPKQADETFVRNLWKLNGVLHGSRWYFFWLMGGEAFLLFLAAVLSVAYVSAGRKATLRQVNATLLKISEQLKDNQSASGASTS